MTVDGRPGNAAGMARRLLFLSAILSLLMTGPGVALPDATLFTKLLGLKDAQSVRSFVIPWGGQPGKSLVVVVNEQKEGEGLFPFLVATFDQTQANPRLIARSQWLEWNPDDVAFPIFKGAEGDFARWQIAANETAFGLRLTAQANVGTVNEGKEDLFLFQVKGAAIQCIFHDHAREWQHARDEQDMSDEEKGKSDYERSRIYSFSERMTDGHYDLVSVTKGNPNKSRIVRKWSEDESGSGYGCDSPDPLSAD